MNKFFILFLLAFAFSTTLFGQQYTFAKRNAGENNDITKDVVSDGKNYIYVCGAFEGTMGIADMIGVYNASNWGYDAFITKMDARSGKPLWAKAGNGANGDQFSNAIAMDKSGNIYLTGTFKSSIKFDKTIITGSGYENLFLAKFNPDGTLIWMKMAGGNGQSRTAPNDLKIGDDGKVYVTGSLLGAANFGNINLKSDSGVQALFVAKYDSSGNIIWGKKFGESGFTTGEGIETDKNNNLYITGSYTDTLIAGKDSLYTDGYNYTFVLSLDKNGKSRWLKKYADAYSTGNAIKLGAKGKLYIAGENNLSSLLMQIDTADGALKWMKFSTTHSAHFNNITVDKKENIYVTGVFFGGVIIDNIKLQGGCNGCSNNGSDMLIIKYNDTGKAIWGQQGGGSGFDDIGYGIDVDQKGDIYVAGIYTSPANFGSFYLDAYNGQQTESFLAKINSHIIYGKPFSRNNCQNIIRMPFTYTLNQKMETGNMVIFEMSDTNGIFKQAALLKRKDTSAGLDTFDIILPSHKLAMRSYAFRLITTAPVDTFYLPDGLIFLATPKVSFIINDTAQCIPGNLFSITNNSTGPPAANLYYIWKTGKGVNSYSLNPKAESYTISGQYTYTLIVVTDKQCRDTAFQKISVYYKPKTDFTVNDSMQCFRKNNFIFINKSTAKDSNKLTTRWEFGDGTYDSILNDSHIYSKAFTYKVKLIMKSSNGCAETAVKTITIFPVDTAHLKVDAHCEGETGLIIPYNLSHPYDWYRNDTLISDTSTILEVKTSGIYRYMSGIKGCRDTSAADTFLFNGRPVKPSLQKSADTLFGRKNYVKYQWFRDTVLLTGDTSNRLTLSQNGNYYLEVWNTNGCEEFSDTFNFNTSSIATRYIFTDIYFYPNPGNGIFKCSVSPNKFKALEISDVLGNVFYTSDMITPNIDLSHLPDGIYFARILTLKGEKQVFKIIKIND